MKTNEPNINSKSEYFINTPSALAKRLYFYVNSVGHFFYEQNYYLHRDRYDSFLLIHVVSGKLYVEADCTVSAGQTVLINCYAPHTYYCKEPCECYWIHFDGTLAQTYFEEIKHTGVATDDYTNMLPQIYAQFKGMNALEHSISNHIAELLQAFLHPSKDHQSVHNNTSIANIRSFIDANFDQELSLDELASLAGFSPFHFLRLFKEQTGYTPHDYIKTVRLNHATYMLKNTSTPITDICYTCGYSSPSIFTTAFKNAFGCTPREYRSKK